MDKREMLKNMLNNFINDKPEEATLDLHNYLSTKMREISGLATSDFVPPTAAEMTDAEVAGEDATDFDQAAPESEEE